MKIETNSAYTAATTAAAVATRDQVLVRAGRPAQVFLSASCGGHSAPAPTVSAHAVLRNSGRSQRSSRSIVDQVAAVVLLQQALDVEKSTGRPPGTPVSQEPA